MEPTTLINGALGNVHGSVRFRVNVHEALAATKRATTVPAQAALHGIDRTHMHRIRTGERTPGLALAMKMARDLGTTVEALFEFA